MDFEGFGCQCHLCWILGQLGSISNGQEVLMADCVVGTERTGETMEKVPRKRENRASKGRFQRGARFCLLGTTPRKSLSVLSDDGNNSWEEWDSTEEMNSLLT